MQTDRMKEGMKAQLLGKLADRSELKSSLSKVYKEKAASQKIHERLMRIDPYLIHGIGTVNFLNINWALIRGFFVMSVIAGLQTALMHYDTRHYTHQKNLSWQDDLREVFTMGRYAQSHA